MSDASPAPEATPERRTTAVELFWDLVFVFAVTQVTTLLAHDTSWARFGQGMLVLALVWWAWSAFVAGIIILAGGLRLVAQNSVTAPMPDAGRLAMCAGAATYLVGLAAFRLRMLGERSYGRVLTAVALMVLYLVSGGFPAWVVGALIAALLGALCGAEVALGAADERVESAPVPVRPGPPGAEHAG